MRHFALTCFILRYRHYSDCEQQHNQLQLQPEPDHYRAATVGDYHRRLTREGVYKMQPTIQGPGGQFPTTKMKRVARISTIAIGILVMPFVPLYGQQQSLTLPSLFHFDGTSYVTLANSSALAPTSQVTIAAWIKPDFTVSNFVDTVIEKRDACGNNRSYDFGVYKQGVTNLGGPAAGTIFFSPSVAGDDTYSSALVPNDGGFHHVAATYDGSLVKIFLDGTLVGQSSHSGVIPSTSYPPIIGSDQCGHPAYADIAQIRISSYAVPDPQIMSESAGFALLSGGNSFVGNQNITGVVTASSFVGDGSSISNINPSNIASGTAAINISGTAASAVNASTAANAANSSNLAGVAGSNYARVDVANAFQANQSIAGNLSATGNLSSGGTLTIGSGTPITRHISVLFQNVAFNTKISPATCTTWSGTVSGAADGDTVGLGMGSSLMSANIVFSAWATNGSVKVRICNPTGSPTTVGSGNIRVDVWKH
jgi:hypothetical protein